MPISKRPSIAAHIAAAPRRHDNDNPLWAGPCAEGPLGGITQSMIVRFLSCRERFRLKYVLGLEPHDKWNKNIGFGNMWHVCEEELASAGVSWEGSLAAHLEVQMACYPAQRDEIYKWFRVCKVQFPEYVRYWRDHPDVLNRTPLFQEQVFDVPFALPSGRTVRLRGKFDSVDFVKNDTEFNGGGIYLQENKTKGDIDKQQVERQLKFDLQTMLYLIALVRWLSDLPPDGAVYVGDYNATMEILQSYTIEGVRYNVVRRPLSGGKGSIRPHAAKHTKYKTIPAETEDEFYERLRRDYISSDPDYWFFRVKTKVAGLEYLVFIDTCLNPILETICDWYDRTCPNNRGPHSQTDNSGINYRTPFGVYSALEEGGATEYDAFLETGSEAGLHRVTTLFPELQ